MSGPCTNLVLEEVVGEAAVFEQAIEVAQRSWAVEVVDAPVHVANFANELREDDLLEHFVGDHA